MIIEIAAEIAAEIEESNGSAKASATPAANIVKAWNISSAIAPSS